MKKIIVLLAIMAASLYAANSVKPTDKQVLRVHLYGGAYKDFPVDRIDSIWFAVDPNDPTVPDPVIEPDTLPISSSESVGTSSSVALSSAEVSSSGEDTPSISSSSEETPSLNRPQGFGNVARWYAGSKKLTLVSSENTKAEVYIFGPQGMCLSKKKVLLIPGYNQINYEELDLAHKVFFVRIKTSSKDVILKIQETK